MIYLYRKRNTATCKLKASKKQFYTMKCVTSKTVGFTFYHHQTFVADIISKRQQASFYEVDYITQLINEALSIWHINTSQLVNDECVIEVVLYGDEADDLQCGVRMILYNDYMVEVGYIGNIVARAKYGNYVIDWRFNNLTTTTSETWSILHYMYENLLF